MIAHGWRQNLKDVGDEALMRRLDTAFPRCVRGYPDLAAGVSARPATKRLTGRRALEAAGVEFTNWDQPGVRLTKAAARASGLPKSIGTSKAAAAKVGRATKPK
jgi:hypothetical protein